MDVARARRRYSKTKPLMKWVPVLDGNGRVRMEMRWNVAAKTVEARERTVVQTAA
ncbi:MAG: hypothetical protein WBG57_09385 [Ornithinimicrobium sp.]